MIRKLGGNRNWLLYNNKFGEKQGYKKRISKPINWKCRRKCGMQKNNCWLISNGYGVENKL